jgi:hypothetical protein
MPFRNIIDVQERRVATCFPPTLCARPGSQANAALEGHSHISHSTAAGNPPTSYLTIPFSATRSSCTHFRARRMKTHLLDNFLLLPPVSLNKLIFHDEDSDRATRELAQKEELLHRCHRLVPVVLAVELVPF